ncbi:DUF1223 domain-containing protein [Roseibium aggregatum]|uniref:DUF1223 domain-containing protein n=1 Tax=Roseibium aggregatum TaxID=187304 RepID=A0A926P050_9HYPH|nr:DUF1223 domain-containing protein [Roseibium aggregatum]MBD1546845.1 DUF1223 domain-containing protein [Roseibium aggregatum]
MGKLKGPASALLRRTIIVSSIVTALTAAGPVSAEPQAVAELFTSQGCSSCPPADRLVEKMVNTRDDVLALVLPVDYWDYLGWKDTLARPAYSARQRAYAARRGDRSVYTPQIVVNGDEHVVGSNKAAVGSALKRAAPFTAHVSLKASDMAIEATVDGALPKGAHMATVLFLRVKDHKKVAIGRGENAGATVNYVNVVRSLQPIGMWDGKTETFRMPKSELIRSGDERCAVLIQLEDDEGPGQIIGAAILDMPPHS